MRGAFFINGLYTILTEYSKFQSIKGAGKIVARTPAYQVNRLLILVIGVVYYAAGYIGCYMGMAKPDCSRYFYELFVLSGRSMSRDKFGKTLAEYNTANAGIDLRLADFRQFMAALLISSTSFGFIDLEEEDPNVIAAHKSFNHSVKVGRTHYGRDEAAGVTKLAPDVIARMQMVSLQWQAFIELIHPTIHAQIGVKGVRDQNFDLD